MAFFDNLGDSIVTAGKDLSKKARGVSGIAKLKMDIHSKEEYVKEQYLHIGKSYYHSHKGEDVPEKEMFDRVEEALDDIAQMKLKILELKKTKKCPNCGAEAADTAEYCSVCGTKLGVVVNDEEAGDEEAGAEAAGDEEAGAEAAGSEEAGAEAAGSEEAGTEAAGSEEAGTE